MRGLRTFVAVVFLGTGASPVLLATSMEKEDLARITSEADRIFIATVASMNCQWDAHERKIFTHLQLDVTQGIKGTNAGERIDLRVVGGAAEVPGRGALTLTVPGVPQFIEGERVLLFVQDNPLLLCPIAGWFQGAFQILQDPPTGKDVIADHEGNYLTGLEGNAVRIDGPEGRVEVNQLVARVRALATAEPAPRDAGAARPAIPSQGQPRKVELVDMEPGHGECAPSAQPRRGSAAPSSLYTSVGVALLAIGVATLVRSARRARSGGVR